MAVNRSWSILSPQFHSGSIACESSNGQYQGPGSKGAVQQNDSKYGFKSAAAFVIAAAIWLLCEPSSATPPLESDPVCRTPDRLAFVETWRREARLRNPAADRVRLAAPPRKPVLTAESDPASGGVL